MDNTADDQILSTGCNKIINLNGDTFFVLISTQGNII